MDVKWWNPSMFVDASELFCHLFYSLTLLMDHVVLDCFHVQLSI